MSNRYMTIHRLTKFLVLAVLSLAWDANVQAEEKRCNELGANCICSEPFNTNSYTVNNGAWYNPADSTSKECRSSGVNPGGPLEQIGGGTFSAGMNTPSSGEAINALPSGHTNTYVLAANEGRGFGFIGGKMPPGTPTARMAVRFYKYWSTNYAWVGGACLNSNKLAEFGYNGAGTMGPIFTETAGTWAFYGVTNNGGIWNQYSECCSKGPGGVPGPSLSSIRGKWLRVEIILHNAAPTGAATKWEVYLKNVTDNTPEIKIIDTSIATTMPEGGSANWSSSNATSLHPGNLINEISLDGFRNGTCSGYAAVSHYLAAAWSTDAGQRIGAATEMEGGGGTGNITPPPPPANLRVSMLMGQ